MFKKLLKYDARSVFKIWWIGALISVASALVGGLLFNFLGNFSENSENFILNLILIFSRFAAVLCIFTMMLSLVMTVVIIIVRFYKHFFTDEGYLTFTLPTSRAALLLSKTVNAMIWYSLHILVLFASAFLFASLVVPIEEIKSLFVGIGESLKIAWQSIGGWLIVYIFEALLLLVAFLLLSITLIYFCITFASVLLKKARAIVAVVVYYALTSAFSFIGQLTVYIFGIAFSEASPVLFDNATANQEFSAVSLLILIIIAIVSAISAILYSITQYLLDRKLNLA